MNLLAFETATPRGGAALIVNDALAGQRTIDDAQAHSRFCLKAAEELLAEAGLQWNDIDVYAASHGPGSFTGVRVGLTLAKSLAYAAGKRVFTVSSLAAIARNSYHGGAITEVMPLIDARMDEVYGAIHRIVDGALVLEPVKEFCAKPNDILSLVTPTTLLCGEGARRHADLFRGNLAPEDRMLSEPSATALLALSMLKSHPPQEPAQANAVYWRDPVRKP